MVVFQGSPTCAGKRFLLSPVTSSLLDHCPVSRAAMRLILIKLLLVIKITILPYAYSRSIR